MLPASKAKVPGASTTGLEKPSCPFTSPGKFPVSGARSGSLLAAVRLAIGWRGSARLSFTVTLIDTATFRWSRRPQDVGRNRDCHVWRRLIGHEVRRTE